MVSIRLPSFGFSFMGYKWLVPLLNGGLSRAGCGGEMFPSSGGRTEPGRGFRPEAGVMVPISKLLWSWAPANAACSSLFSALLLSPMRPGHADQESKHSSISNSLVQPVSCQLVAAGSPVEWELLVLSPSSSVTVYLLSANHKP